MNPFLCLNTPTKILVASLFMFCQTLFGQEIKRSGFCHVENDEKAAKNYISQGHVEQRGSCTAEYINVFFHFIRDNSGATGQPTSNVPTYMTILNNAFSGHNIQFISTGFDQINNSTLAATNYDHMTNFSGLTMNHQSNAINIYIFRADKTTATSGGIATRPGIRVAIGGGDAWATNYTLSNVLSHEVGHALNLYHTFYGTESGSVSGCAENPNGSNGATCGDEIVDTPADPNIAFSNSGVCSNPFTMVVGGTTYNPNPTNIMSYATANCLNQFTGGQGTRMNNALSSLAVYPAIRSTISGPSLICTTGTYSIAVPTGTTIAWSSSNTGAVTINSSGVASRVGSYSGSVTINALLTNGSGCTRTLSTITWVGAPTFVVSIDGINTNTAYLMPGSNHSSNATTLSAGITTYNYSNYSGSGDMSISISPTGSYAYLYVNSSSTTGHREIIVSGTNTCGTLNQMLYLYLAGTFKMYPNPTKTELTLEFPNTQVKNTLPVEVTLLAESSMSPVKTISVWDYFDKNQFKDGNKILLDVSQLRRGTYYLHVKYDASQENRTEKIRVILE